MRDQRFIAEHRGGPLAKAQHYQLMEWACNCAQHVSKLFGGRIDVRVQRALDVARKWKTGTASVGDCRKAALGAIRVATKSLSETAIAVARSTGHAAATAHMADHSLEAASYALKAVENAGGSLEMERQWQHEKLPLEIRGLVLSARKSRNI